MLSLDAAKFENKMERTFTFTHGLNQTTGILPKYVYRKIGVIHSAVKNLKRNYTYFRCIISIYSAIKNLKRNYTYCRKEISHNARKFLK